ncbi:MAG: hypothetical protein U0T32_07390 [Chitinophagales bacterium]
MYRHNFNLYSGIWVLAGGTGAWNTSNAAVATVNSLGVVPLMGAGSCNIYYTVTGGCKCTQTSNLVNFTVTPTASAGTVTAGTTPQCIPLNFDPYGASVVVRRRYRCMEHAKAVATVNSSGVVTPVGAGSCNIYYTVTGGCEVHKPLILCELYRYTYCKCRNRNGWNNATVYRLNFDLYSSFGGIRRRYR